MAHPLNLLRVKLPRFNTFIEHIPKKWFNKPFPFKRHCFNQMGLKLNDFLQDIAIM